MKYLCLAYYDVDKYAALPKPELDAIVSRCPQYDAELRASGRLLLPARSVRRKRGWPCGRVRAERW